MKRTPMLSSPAPAPTVDQRLAERFCSGLHFAAAMATRGNGSPLVIDLSPDGCVDPTRGGAAHSARFLLSFAAAHGITGAA